MEDTKLFISPLTKKKEKKLRVRVTRGLPSGRPMGAESQSLLNSKKKTYWTLDET